eukprot:jgi/Botrbrau1/1013/Bobra.114_1s0051.1
MVDENSSKVANASTVLEAPGDSCEENVKPAGERVMVRFASTQEVLAPSNSMPTPHFGESASFKDSDIRSKAHSSLESLLQGNKRFVAGQLERCKADKELLEELQDWQTPIAAVLACSDSRVPPEMVFDQGLGDLFVVRVSGNCVNEVVMGSLLMAVKLLNVRLLIVLGHSRCHMVASAIKNWAKSTAQQPSPVGTGGAAGAPEDTLPYKVSASLVPPVSAFANVGPPHVKEGKDAAKGKQPGVLARMCACWKRDPSGSQEEQQGTPGGSVRSGSARSTSPTPQSGRTTPTRRSIERPSQERLSVNPIAAILNMVQGSVETVAHGNRAKEFNTMATSLAEHDQEEEEEVPTRNGALLRTADSLGVTRMRLEKQRQQTLLSEIATMEGMEDVILENIRQSATLILKGMVKNLPPEVAREVEVVGAKYDLATGVVEVERRGWWSGRTFYWEKDP